MKLFYSYLNKNFNIVLRFIYTRSINKKVSTHVISFIHHHHFLAFLSQLPLRVKRQLNILVTGIFCSYFADVVPCYCFCSCPKSFFPVPFLFSSSGGFCLPSEYLRYHIGVKPMESLFMKHLIHYVSSIQHKRKNIFVIFFFFP